MKKIFNVFEKDNSILSMDFDPTGHHLASGGKDCAVRIYD
jgi:WD40 repeat protein